MTGMTQQAEPDLNEEPAGNDEVVPPIRRKCHWWLHQLRYVQCTFSISNSSNVWFNPLRICRVIEISLSVCYNSVASSS